MSTTPITKAAAAATTPSMPTTPTTPITTPTTPITTTTTTPTTSPESPASPSRPPPPKHRKSLLQKLNKKHEALISHMRAKRTAKETDRKDDTKSPSRSWKLSRRDSTMASSIKSITRSEHEELEGGSRDYNTEETLPLSIIGTPPLGDAYSEQDFWYTGTREDSALEPSASSFLLASSLRSTFDSTSFISEFSALSPGKVLLGKFDDAVVHLERTLSVDSAKTKVDSRFGCEEASKIDNDDNDDNNDNDKDHDNDNNDDDDDALIYELPEREDERIVGTLSGGNQETELAKSNVILDLFSEGWNTHFEPATDEKEHIDTTTGVEVVPPEIVIVQTGIVEDEKSRLLSLPDVILQRMALQLDTTSTQLLRLSCKKLHDLLPKSPSPTRSHNEMQPIPPPILSLTYCPECVQCHPWTQSDFYMDTSQVRRCRRYLYSNRQPMSDMLGAGNYLCENCNTVRRDQKCKTCLKCEECAALRRTWIIISWVEDECDECVASHPPQWKHWKDEFEGRIHPGAHREWMGM